MRFLGRRSLVLSFSLTLMAAGALWATTSRDAGFKKAMLPDSVGATAVCGPESDPSHYYLHEASIDGLGTFTEVDAGKPTKIMAEIGEHYTSKQGLKTVPLKIVSIGGVGHAEGIGETRFWFDATRPVTSAIWEKRAGTEFPAIQEMRFNFFYTVEAMPGRVFRSVQPARMRSEDVRSFPPTPGTTYRLVRPVELEDVSNPGVVVGKILSNQVVIPKSRGDREREIREQ